MKFYQSDIDLMRKYFEAGLELEYSKAIDENYKTNNKFEFDYDDKTYIFHSKDKELKDLID